MTDTLSAVPSGPMLIAPDPGISAHPALPAQRAIGTRLLRYWSIAAGMATAMTLFTGFQTMMQFLLRGQEMSYVASLQWSAIIWYLWALLAPFAVLLTLRYPLERGQGLVRAILFTEKKAEENITVHA